MVLNVDKIIQRIRLLFKEEYIYSNTELIKRIQHIKNYPDDQIYFALHQLINDDNEYLVDMYGRIGRIKNIDTYYLFQPIEINDFSQIYDNKHIIDVKEKQIVYTLPEKVKEKSIKKENKIQELNTILENEMDKLKHPKKIQSTDKNDNSKIAAWMIKILHQFDGIAKTKLYEYALYHILEGFNHDDKLLWLNYLYDDKTYNENIDYHVYSKAYFERFIHTKIIGLILNNKIKYYQLNDKNKWNLLPSIKKKKICILSILIKKITTTK